MALVSALLTGLSGLGFPILFIVFNILITLITFKIKNVLVSWFFAIFFLSHSIGASYFFIKFASFSEWIESAWFLQFYGFNFFTKFFMVQHIFIMKMLGGIPQDVDIPSNVELLGFGKATIVFFIVQIIFALVMVFIGNKVYKALKHND